jgi:hypothetical protein
MMGRMRDVWLKWNWRDKKGHWMLGGGGGLEDPGSGKMVL